MSNFVQNFATLMKQFKIWLEAVRLRTLPVSLSGVLIALGLAKWNHAFRLAPALLCLAFALLAQVVSNFANEYYDYKSGADKRGRAGFRRGVTEGDIKPAVMRRVMFSLLGLTCLVGLCMLAWVDPGYNYNNWLMLLAVGVLVAVFALAYSAGPYPLSYHALGEVAVFLFYGLVPVIFTYYVVTGMFGPFAVMAGIAIGFMGVNVLLVNNYRDVDDDREAGKRTSVVVFGRQAARLAYLANGFLALGVLTVLWLRIYYTMPLWALLAPVVYINMHFYTWMRLRRSEGAQLNGLLGATARNMLVFTLLLIIPLVVLS